MPPAGKSRAPLWSLVANFWSFFAIFTLFGAFSLCTVGAVLAIFPDIFRICWDFLGTPANYCADFGAILAIFEGAATAAGLSTAARHRRICAARQTPSGGPWSKRP